MRGLAREALTETGNVIGAGSVTDDGGGGATFTVAAGSDIPCRVDSLTGAEGEAAERISDRSTHLISVPPDTDIDTRQSFAVDNRGTYEVTAVRENTDGFIAQLEAVLRV